MHVVIRSSGDQESIVLDLRGEFVLYEHDRVTRGVPGPRRDDVCLSMNQGRRSGTSLRGLITARRRHPRDVRLDARAGTAVTCADGTAGNDYRICCRRTGPQI